MTSRIPDTHQNEYSQTAVLDKAGQLFDSMEFQHISMAAIAREAGIDNKAICKHFTSKEEVYLSLLTREIQEWMGDLESTFRGRTVPLDVFVDGWATILVDHQRMLALLGHLYISIEKNVSVDSLTWFKLSYKDDLREFMELLCEVLPPINPVQAEEFVYFQISLGLGLNSVTNLSEKQQQAMHNASMSQVHGSFEVRLKNALLYYLRGMLQK